MRGGATAGPNPRALAVVALGFLSLLLFLLIGDAARSSGDISSVQDSARKAPHASADGGGHAEFQFLVPNGYQKALFRAMGNGPGPVVVGGIGDSGTRGTRDVLRYFGVHMLGKQFTNAGPGDSRIFEMNYEVIDPFTLKPHIRNVRKLYVDAIRHARTLNYNATTVAPADWAMGIELISQMSWLSMNTSRMMRNDGRNKEHGLWGYKHPRTALVLPYLIGALGPKLRFIHVLRDPKEVVHGSNQMVYVDMCGRYYGHPCPDTLDSRLEFWADLNMDVLHVAKAQLRPHQYMIVRTEDLVSGFEVCYRRIARFVDALPDHVEAHLTKALNHSMAHVGSYLGRSLTAEERKSVVSAVARAKPRVKDALSLLGYSDKGFRLLRTCEELPGPVDT